MKLEFEIYDYLSSEEIKEACKYAIKDCISRIYGQESQIERLISNLSYMEVWKMVDDCIDGDLEEVLKNKSKEVIEELSPHDIFRRKDAWEREESTAYKILQEEMKVSRPLLKKRVETIIEQYNFNEISTTIADVVYECVMNKLFKESEKE